MDFAYPCHYVDNGICLSFVWQKVLVLYECVSLWSTSGVVNKRKKLRMSQETAKQLGRFREILWATLTMLMLLGVGFQWMDYEVFAAFILQSASVVVLVLAVVVLALSIFIPRPYCRFVFPTGVFLNISQKSKS